MPANFSSSARTGIWPPRNGWFFPRIRTSPCRIPASFKVWIPATTARSMPATPQIGCSAITPSSTSAVSYSLDGSNGAVFENNTVIRDASISTPTSVITHVMAGNWAQHFMLLNNTFEVQGGTLPRKNDGEVAGSEGGGQTRRDEFRGTVQYAGPNSITDSSQNFNWSPNNAIPNLHVGAILAIVGGQGAGQWATITNISADGHIVWVDHNWAVTPPLRVRITRPSTGLPLIGSSAVTRSTTTKRASNFSTPAFATSSSPATK